MLVGVTKLRRSDSWYNSWMKIHVHFKEQSGRTTIVDLATFQDFQDLEWVRFQLGRPPSQIHGGVSFDDGQAISMWGTIRARHGVCGVIVWGAESLFNLSMFGVSPSISDQVSKWHRAYAASDMWSLGATFYEAELRSCGWHPAVVGRIEAAFTAVRS